MSIISNTHTFVKLERNTAPLHGQRLSRLIAKADRNGKYPSPNLSESLAVSVPMVEDMEVVDAIDTLLPHIKGWIQGVQDALIREFRIEHGRNEVPEDAFSVAACVAWLDENAKGDRVTKEYLAEWFAENYSTACAAWIESVAPGMDSEVVQSKVNVMRDMIAAWASPKASPAIPALKATLRFTHHLSQSGGMCARLAAIAQKAHTLLEKKENELKADALGF